MLFHDFSCSLDMFFSKVSFGENPGNSCLSYTFFVLPYIYMCIFFVIVAAGSLRGRRGRPSQRRANLCWPQLSSARALKNYWMKLGERLQSYYRSTMRLLCQKLVKSDLKIGQYYESKVFHSIEVTQFYSYTGCPTNLWTMVFHVLNRWWMNIIIIFYI